MNALTRRFWKAVAGTLLPARPKTSSRPAPRRRLGLEVLEDRAVPAVLMVTSAADDLSAGTLRSAVGAANLMSVFNATPVTIDFAPALSGKTITLTHGQIDLFGSSKAPITIDGGGAITLSGNHAGRIFEVEQGGDVDLERLTITAGTAKDAISAPMPNEGGGIANFGILEVDRSNVTGNSAFDGAGILNAGGTLTVLDSTISGNSTSGHGGGIFNSFFDFHTAYLEVVDSTISDNSANTGGGIENAGFATVTGSSIFANSAGSIFGVSSNNSGLGGGIDNDNNSVLSVTDSTLAANYAGQGGAVFNSGTATFSDSTVAANIGVDGGGIRNSNALILESTIVADNLGQTGPDIHGSASGSFNLIGNNSFLTGLANGDAKHNLVGTAAKPLDPHLAPLNYYGGPTKTMPVLTGSPAINAGGPLTTLSSAISATATTIPLGDVHVIGVSGSGYVIQVGSEQMLVVGGNTVSNTVTVQRGYNGTAAAAHAAGSGIFLADDESGRTRVVNGHTNIGAMGPTLVLTNTTLTVKAGSKISVQLMPSGGVGPYTFSNAALFPWLKLSKDGLLTGTVPASPATDVYGFTLEIGDSSHLSGYYVFTIVVTP